MSSPQNVKIDRLSDSNLIVIDPALDIRGRAVFDKAGQKIGKVRDLFIGETDRKVRFVEIAHGGFLNIAAEHFLIPADAITKVEPDAIQVDQSSEHIASAPVYDPSVTNKAEYYAELYRHYGYPLWWDSPYQYPGIYDPMI